MTLSRRDMFVGAGATLLASALPAAAVALPTLTGDGKADDTAGLNAYFAGKPVQFVGDHTDAFTQDGRLGLRRGQFRSTGPVEFALPSVISGAIWIQDFTTGGEPTIAGRPNVDLHEVWFEGLHPISPLPAAFFAGRPSPGHTSSYFFFETGTIRSAP